MANLTDEQLQEIETALQSIDKDPAFDSYKTSLIESLSANYDDKYKFTDAVISYSAIHGLTPGFEAYINAERAGQASLNVAKKKTELEKAGQDANQGGQLEKDYMTNKAAEVAAAQAIAADDPEDLTRDERISLAQQTYQCFLLHNLEAFAEFHRKRFNTRMLEASPAIEKAPFFIESSGDQRILLVDDSHPDGAFFATNKMTSLGKTKNLDKVRPSEVAQLMPKLRIYKIFRHKGEETAKVELKFDNKTDVGFLTAPRTSSGFAKGEGSGIRSFNWSFIGGDPFTATRDLTATLKVYFQDFQDLIKVRQGPNLFKPSGPAGVIKQEYRYLDLVLQADCRESLPESNQLEEEATAQSLGYDVYHPECYEIAVEVGYADVSMVSSNDMSKDTKEVIKKQSDVIYLTMKEHTFDIAQDGTFELTINYNARLSSFLGDKGMNVLLPGGGYAVETEGVNGEGSLQWSLTAIDDLIKEEKKNAEDGSTKRNERLKKLEMLRDIVISKSTISLHSGIMKTLFARNMVYKTEISHEEFSAFSYFGQIDRRKKDSLSITDFNENTGTGTVVGIDDQGTDCPEASSVSEEDTQTFAAVNPLESQDERLSELKRDHTIFFTTLGDIVAVITEHVLGETSVIPKGNVLDPNISAWIDGITDGDLEGETGDFEKAASNFVTGVKYVLGMATKPDQLKRIEQFGEQFEEGLKAGGATEAKTEVKLNSTQAKLLERFRIILGTLAYKSTVDDQVHSINLAHLPISLEAFQKFFHDNVIMTYRTFYSYQDFVRDLLKDLILKNMQRECFGGYFENSVKAGISLLKSQGIVQDEVELEPITNRGDENIYGPRDKKLTYDVLKMKNANEKNPIFTSIESKNVKNYDYMLFSAYSTKGWQGSLSGNEEEDRNVGIPHFRFGQTKGFLKSANFAKTPLEFAAEERYVREGSSNMLNQLAGRYEMQLNMVGNSVFHPGQYVYFDPVAMGVGKPNENNGGEARSFANRMGLGGYHIITEVGSSISVGKFETTIKALHDTSGQPTSTVKD